MVVRLVHERDAYRLADYYAENRTFLKPWEPVRDESHCYPSGWQARLGMITEMQKQGSAYYFILLDPEEQEVLAWRTSATCCAVRFTPVSSVIRWGEMAGDKG